MTTTATKRSAKGLLFVFHGRHLLLTHDRRLFPLTSTGSLEQAKLKGANLIGLSPQTLSMDFLTGRRCKITASFLTNVPSASSHPGDLSPLAFPFCSMQVPSAHLKHNKETQCGFSLRHSFTVLCLEPRDLNAMRAEWV